MKLTERKDFTRLSEAYKRFESLPLAERQEPEPEPVQDPRDPWLNGKEIAVRLTRFLIVCMRTFGGKAVDLVFATELFALNVHNANDLPLTPAARDAARKAAYDYYVASLPHVPEKNE